MSNQLAAARQRVSAYINRRKIATGLDIERVHCFDNKFDLLLSDLVELVAAHEDSLREKAAKPAPVAELSRHLVSVLCAASDCLRQVHGRDPERTMVCDILANGSLLINGKGELAPERYAPAQAQQAGEPLTNIESPFNACQHREHCKGWKMVATDVVGRAKPEARQPLTREQVKALLVAGGYEEASHPDQCAFINGIRYAELAHGIGASGEASK